MQTLAQLKSDVIDLRMAYENCYLWQKRGFKRKLDDAKWIVRFREVVLFSLKRA